MSKRKDGSCDPLSQLLDQYEKPVAKAKPVGSPQDGGQVKKKEKCKKGAVLGDDFILHKVTAADTLGGLELRYGVPSFDIRQANGMSSDRLTSYLELRIPISKLRWRPTNFNSFHCETLDITKLQVQRIFRVHFPGILDAEIDYYVNESDGTVKDAVAKCREDMDWERNHFDKCGAKARSSSEKGSLEKSSFEKSSLEKSELRKPLLSSPQEYYK
uniref:LysM domain-containing protein n=1 Tax=Mucochytrium quahogii TaxID=96639 RepID=A0A7S2WD69_9STRA|mmetsp:Transcript_2752/g.3932  ORF Transcript_2752/g.3932 Transcript_2752/m.3932 type:complete len:215 (-) Transcript_2752:307-951(-)|eukprot:CAMPEP_0203749846 /NCGR_PEP_ID=MMETSP0098-20131031/4242_1 /ASSEMBLY_ACC=CAM_ASM_000208 /TAXON_ID=96639 /ORGANISM=" , Strain NY0313808BC1" /LENGTH=214 /DNA_ID=CAMNT_0050638963 /DNA_START=410 /DNA_END=1054 /DNA_ORIENTATION=+